MWAAAKEVPVPPPHDSSRHPPPMSPADDRPSPPPAADDAHGRREPWRLAARRRLTQRRGGIGTGAAARLMTVEQPSVHSSQGLVGDAASLIPPPLPSQDQPEDAPLLPKATT